MTGNIAELRVQIWDWNEKTVEVPYFQLLQWQAGLRIECKTGMKLSRGSVHAHLRKLLSVPTDVKFTKFDMLKHIETSVNSIKEQMGERS